MTFKDLERFLEENNYNDDSSKKKQNKQKIEDLNLKQQLYSLFHNKPFWIENITEHKAEDRRTKGYCCFNHIIGLPKKDGVDKPMFDYEMQLATALDNNKNIFIKKARGLGITELILRYMAWLCVKDETYKNKRFHIVTGPRINLAEELIDRLHNLFMDKLQIDCKQIGPIIYLNDTTIQAFPSHTVQTMRGYTDVKFIFIDEAAFFITSQQEECKAVAEGYRIKSDPHIVVVSTPNKPGDFFEQIDKDPKSVFTKLNFHYSVGLDKIYNPAEIEREKNQPYFRREYELAYAVGTGNVFIESTIQAAEQLGEKYKQRRSLAFRNYLPGTVKVLGIDPGFGSSATGFTLIEIVDGILNVLYSKQFKNASTQSMVTKATDLMLEYHMFESDQNKVMVDGSAPGFIRSLKTQITGETIDYDYIIDRARQNGHDETKLYLYMRVVPVNFSTRGKSMLGNLKKYMDMGKIAVDTEEHRDLLTELRIATSDEELKLVKDQTNTMDLLDSLRLCMAYIR